MYSRDKKLLSKASSENDIVQAPNMEMKFLRCETRSCALSGWRFYVNRRIAESAKANENDSELLTRCRFLCF